MENFKCTQRSIAFISIHRMLERGTINMNPDFQRKFVYDDKKQSKLIESILKGVVIPHIILVETKEPDTNNADDMMYEVIDGKQRLNSIHRFLGGHLKLKLSDNSELNNKTFKDLTTKQQDYIETANIQVVTLPYECRKYKFDLFERYNTGSVKLNAQEIRNGTSESYFNKLARDLADDSKSDFFKIAHDIDNGRLLRNEVILQILAESNELKNVPDLDSVDMHSSPKVVIDKYMLNNEISEEECEQIKDRFNKWCKICVNVFGEEAIKNKKNKTHKHALIMLVEYVAYHYDEKNKARILLLSKDNLKKAAIGIADKIQKREYELKQFGFRLAYCKTRKEIFDDLDSVLEKVNIDEARIFSEENKLQKYNEQEGKCAVCGQHFEYRFMHGDHVVPWSKGGATTYDNLQMLCERCNLEKSNKQN